MTPKVTISRRDGQLGILPPSSGKLLAVCGPSTLGTVDTPTAYSRVDDLISAFGYGPAVQFAAGYIANYGRSVLFCRTAATTAGSTGTSDSFRIA